MRGHNVCFNGKIISELSLLPFLIWSTDIILFSSELYCISEYHLFLVLYGVYSGVMYVFFHYYKQQNYLQFPSLQVGQTLTLGPSVMTIIFIRLKNRVFPSLEWQQITKSVLWNFAIRQILSFLNSPKDLDLSYKTDLDFLDYLEGKKLCLITEET